MRSSRLQKIWNIFGIFLFLNNIAELINVLNNSHLEINIQGKFYKKFLNKK